MESDFGIDPHSKVKFHLFNKWIVGLITGCLADSRVSTEVLFLLPAEYGIF
jgi:hypothetical protein